MINSYTITNQTVDANGLLVFSNNKILTGCTVTHTEGTSTFNLNKAGYYYVTFNGVGTAEEVGTTTVELLDNGVVVPGAIASFSSTAADQIGNLSFSTIIKVGQSCCCVDGTHALTLQNSGASTTFTDVNLVITKLC